MHANFRGDRRWNGRDLRGGGVKLTPLSKNLVWNSPVKIGFNWIKQNYSNDGLFNMRVARYICFSHAKCVNREQWKNVEFPLYCVDSFIFLSIVLLCKEYISSCMIVILTSKRKLISGKDTKEICQAFFIVWLCGKPERQETSVPGKKEIGRFNRTFRPISMGSAAHCTVRPRKKTQSQL